MITHRPTAPSPPGKTRAAFTLPEMLVASAMGGIVLAAVASLSLFSARSFVGIGNYLELDQASQNALDTLSRDIRGMAGLKSYSPASLVFSNENGGEMSVTYDPASRTLTSRQGNLTKTLLTECDYLNFNMSQRTPSNGVFGFYPASRPDLCKLVDMSWRCSRTLLGKKFHTESVQTARIVIRN